MVVSTFVANHALLYASNALAPLYALRPSIAALIATVAVPAVTAPAAIAIASMAIIHAISLEKSHDLSEISYVPAHSISCAIASSPWSSAL